MHFSPISDMHFSTILDNENLRSDQLAMGPTPISKIWWHWWGLGYFCWLVQFFLKVDNTKEYSKFLMFKKKSQPILLYFSKGDEMVVTFPYFLA